MDCSQRPVASRRSGVGAAVGVDVARTGALVEVRVAATTEVGPDGGACEGVVKGEEVLPGVAVASCVVSGVGAVAVCAPSAAGKIKAAASMTQSAPNGATTQNSFRCAENNATPPCPKEITLP